MAVKLRLELLVKLAHQIRTATAFVDEMQAPPEALLTSAELAKLFGADREAVKKHLKILKDWSLVQAIGLNPKRYRFDSYHYRQLLQQPPEDETLQELLNDMEWVGAKFL